MVDLQSSEHWLEKTTLKFKKKKQKKTKYCGKLLRESVLVIVSVYLSVQRTSDIEQ